MRVSIIIALLLLCFSCEKEQEMIDEKCWTCTEMANMTMVRTWKVCDIIEVTELNGLRWITGTTKVTVHKIECK